MEGKSTLKISEYMRKGAEIAQEKGWEIISGQYIGVKDNKVYGVCPLTCVLLAVRSDLDILIYIHDSGDEDAYAIHNDINLYVPQISDLMSYEFGGRTYSRSIDDVIPVWRDHYSWGLERIADYLEEKGY